MPVRSKQPYTPVINLPKLAEYVHPALLGGRGHIDVHLSGAHATWFMEIRAALMESGAKLNNGTVVEHKSDVVKWLVEQPFKGDCYGKENRS